MVKQIQRIFLVMMIFSSACFAETILIKNAKLHTLGTQGTLNQASLLIIDGKISAVAINIPEEEGMTIIDASGKEITPGLMNASTALGLVEISAVSSTVDIKSTEKTYSASVSIAAVINPNSTLFAHNRINGLTRAMVKPDSTKTLIAGRGSLIKLSADMQPVVIADNAMYMKYGEAGARIAGGSRAIALMKINDAFETVKKYLADPKKYKTKKGVKLVDIKALVAVYQGEIPLVVTVNRASDILTMIALQKQYSLKMILSGAKEAWKVADEIASANIAVQIDPYNNLPRRFESIANRIDSATLLHKAGVALIFTATSTPGSSHNAYTIRQTAGNAVAYGLPWDVALSAITSTPAKWFGIGDSYGTLEVGMDADIVIWDGDPLEITTLAERVFIQGKPISMVSRQTRLRDRYMNKGDRPAAYSK